MSGSNFAPNPPAQPRPNLPSSLPPTPLSSHAPPSHHPTLPLNPSNALSSPALSSSPSPSPLYPQGSQLFTFSQSQRPRSPSPSPSSSPQPYAHPHPHPLAIAQPSPHPSSHVKREGTKEEPSSDDDHFRHNKTPHHSSPSSVEDENRRLHWELDALKKKHAKDAERIAAEVREKEQLAEELRQLRAQMKGINLSHPQAQHVPQPNGLTHATSSPEGLTDQGLAQDGTTGAPAPPASADAAKSKAKVLSDSANSAGFFSCHRCKTRKDNGEAMLCTNESGKKKCGKKYCQGCLPEHDTRVLTKHGFLFLADIEALIEAEQEVLYACYDTATQAIVYAPGRLVEVDPPERWVDFTHAATRRLWDATSDDYGSTVAADGANANHLTLRTTPEHDMFVQLCMKSGEGRTSQYYERNAGRALIPPHKMPARELAPGYHCDCAAAGRVCTHGYSTYRVFTGAAAGVRAPDDVIALTDPDAQSPVVVLGLRTEDELNAFLELFGFWLGDGSMAYATSSGGGVTFSQRKDRDEVYLRDLLQRLGLIERLQWRYQFNKGRTTHVFYITDKRWFRFFDDEFGVKYRPSRHYNMRLALLKQGMHHTQRRPPPAASVSDSTSVAAPSTTRSLQSSAPSLSLRRRSSASTDVEDLDLDDPNAGQADAWCFISRSTAADDHMNEGGLSSDDDADDPDDEELPDPEDGDDEDEDEDAPVRSAKWWPHWALHQLDARQLRLVIEGLRQADGWSAATAAQRQSAVAGGDQMEGGHKVCTSGLGFRDQLIHACLHAGYSAYFELNTRAGTMGGYHAVPGDSFIYTEVEKEAALRADPTREFKPLRTGYDNYWVCYKDDVSELLPAHDVRFDGSACRVRQKTAYKQGGVDVHAGSKRVVRTVEQDELAWEISSTSSAVSRAQNSDNLVGGVWSVFTAGAYEAQMSGLAQEAITIATQPGDLYDRHRDGRVWCVDVQHDDHLIFVQRVHRDASGVITKVGRSILTGNCLTQWHVHAPQTQAGKGGQAAAAAAQSPSAKFLGVPGAVSAMGDAYHWWQPSNRLHWCCPACLGICDCNACQKEYRLAVLGEEKSIPDAAEKKRLQDEQATRFKDWHVKQPKSPPVEEEKAGTQWRAPTPHQQHSPPPSSPLHSNPIHRPGSAVPTPPTHSRGDSGVPVASLNREQTLSALQRVGQGELSAQDRAVLAALATQLQQSDGSGATSPVLSVFNDGRGDSPRAHQFPAQTVLPLHDGNGVAYFPHPVPLQYQPHPPGLVSGPPTPPAFHPGSHDQHSYRPRQATTGAALRAQHAHSHSNGHAHDGPHSGHGHPQHSQPQQSQYPQQPQALQYPEARLPQRGVPYGLAPLDGYAPSPQPQYDAVSAQFSPSPQPVLAGYAGQGVQGYHGGGAPQPGRLLMSPPHPSPTLSGPPAGPYGDERGAHIAAAAGRQSRGEERSPPPPPQASAGVYEVDGGMVGFERTLSTSDALQGFVPAPFPGVADGRRGGGGGVAGRGGGGAERAVGQQPVGIRDAERRQCGQGLGRGRDGAVGHEPQTRTEGDVARPAVRPVPRTQRRGDGRRRRQQRRLLRRGGDRRALRPLCRVP